MAPTQGGERRLIILLAKSLIKVIKSDEISDQGDQNL
jgi:hypothetical protein